MKILEGRCDHVGPVTTSERALKVLREIRRAFLVQTLRTPETLFAEVKISARAFSVACRLTPNSAPKSCTFSCVTTCATVNYPRNGSVTSDLIDLKSQVILSAMSIIFEELRISYQSSV